MSSNATTLKKRLRSVKNIKKITRALQLVAVSKAKKYQDMAKQTTEYMQTLIEILNQLNIKKVPTQFTQFFTHNKNNLQLYIVLAPTRGFTGVLMGNYTRTFTHTIQAAQTNGQNIVAIGLHSKATSIIKAAGLQPHYVHNKTTIATDAASVDEFFDKAWEIYTQLTPNTVFLVYPKFINIFTYQITIDQYLPLPTILKRSVASASAKHTLGDILIEPSKTHVISEILKLYLKGYMGYAIANLNASEFSARMIAMKQATDNAQELQDRLTLEFNKLRQLSITDTIMDVIRATL